MFALLMLEASGCQDKVYMVVNLPIRDILGCCSRQLVGWRKLAMVNGWLFANNRSLHESQSSVVCLSNTVSSFCPCPVSAFVGAYFGIPNALNYKYILLGSLRCDAMKLSAELLDLLVFMV